MSSKLFHEKPARIQISSERWVLVLPDTGNDYQLQDALSGRGLGRILFDNNNNWIYDGNTLTVGEQEEVAGFIDGYYPEMTGLLEREFKNE